MDDDVCIAALPQLQQLVSACCLPVEISGSKELTCVAHTEKVNIYCDGCFDFLNVAPWFSSGLADPSADVPEKMVKRGCWDILCQYVGCYGFYGVVQCFFLTFDVLCGGVSGSDFPLAFTLIVCFNEGDNC